MELSEEQRKAIEQQKQSCPFCQIIAGKIPSQKVYEDDRIIAILDINPAMRGHVLVMPKEHYPIMPLIPEDDFAHLFSYTQQLSARLRKALLTTRSSVFVANGPAAGQQSQHFMLHIIPSDKTPAHFTLPEKTHDQQALLQAQELLAHNLPLMMRKRARLFAQETQGPSELAVMIEEHPELKEAIINNPDGVLAGLKENPSLQPVFAGVDIHELSTQLKGLQEQAAQSAPSQEPRTQEPSEPALQPAPTQSNEASSVQDAVRAVQLEERELVAFINQNNTLKNYLLDDIETLEHAIPQQPKLQTFFSGTSPQEVRDRYLAAQEKTPPRRFGGFT